MSNIIWIIVWIITLLAVFEVPIRSIGRSFPVTQINLLPRFWLSDLGLVLPLFVLALGNGIYSRLLKNRLIWHILAVFAYGTVIALLRANSISLIIGDLRFFLALISGLSLVTLMPNRPLLIGKALCIVSGASTLLILVNLALLPDESLWATYTRVSSAGIFELIGIPLVLFAPCMIFSKSIQDWRYIAVSWLAGGLLIVISILFMQTRSLFLTFAVAFFLALVGTFVMTPFAEKKALRRSKVAPAMLAVGLIVLVSTVIYLRQDNLKMFLSRMESGAEYQEDLAVQVRLMEVIQVLQTMGTSDHLLGKGIGPSSPLVSEEGESYNALHIGILNIWWRFGAMVFLFLLLIIIRLLRTWAVCIFRLLRHRRIDRAENNLFAIVTVFPGVLSLIIVSFMSGGWSIYSMFPLGMLWGFYRSLKLSDIVLIDLPT